MFSLDSGFSSLGYEIQDYLFPIVTNYKTVLKAIDILDQDRKQYFELLCPEILGFLDYLLITDTLSDIEVNKEIENLDKYIIENLFNIDLDSKSEVSDPIISFSQDSGPIVASFIQNYNINIIDQDIDYRLFISLLQSLTKTKMNEIWEVRTMEVPTGKGMEKYRESVIKQKELYKIKGTSKEQSQDEAVLEIAKDILAPRKE